MLMSKTSFSIATVALLLSAPVAFAQAATPGADVGGSATTTKSAPMAKGSMSGTSMPSSTVGRSASESNSEMSKGASGTGTNPDSMGARGSAPAAPNASSTK